MRRKLAIAALLTIAISTSGCAALGAGVKATTAVASAVGGYFSYKAFQQDPVNVTTLSLECPWYTYQTVTAEDREKVPESVLAQIRLNNKLAVKNCPAIRKAWCERHPDGEECEVR